MSAIDYRAVDAAAAAAIVTIADDADAS